MYHEQITTRRELAENLADQLASSSDEMSVYIDLTAQEIYTHVSFDVCGVSDSAYDGHEVIFMSSIDSDEAFDVMEDFARSRPDEQARPLFKALSRPRPFKLFRSALEDTDQLEDWYAFKDKAYVDLAVARLEADGIDVVDGKIVCTDKHAITIYQAECVEGDEDDESPVVQRHISFFSMGSVPIDCLICSDQKSPAVDRPS